jgi:ATP-dependent RNA circularization protein (DNA/RNA ligase family)
VEQTLCQWEEGKICYDFVGRENLMLVKQGGSYRLKIVDVGFFKFDLPEFNLTGKVAQIKQKLERLKHLYQLAKVSN